MTTEAIDNALFTPGTPIDKQESTGQESDSVATQALQRRDFMKKYGALAAITPVAMTLTMHSKKALASSCSDCARDLF